MQRVTDVTGAPISTVYRRTYTRDARAHNTAEIGRRVTRVTGENKEL